MAIPVWPVAGTGPNGVPNFRFISAATKPATPVNVIRFAQALTEQRAVLADREWVTWPAGIGLEANDDGREQITDFLRARDWATESFLLKEPTYFARQLGGPGKITLSGGPTVWDLPTTGEGAGDFPLDESPDTHQLYDDGAPISSTIDTDARTFTTASIAGTITVDYNFAMRVRLVEGSEPEWRYVGFNLHRATLSLIEVAE